MKQMIRNWREIESLGDGLMRVDGKITVREDLYDKNGNKIGETSPIYNVLVKAKYGYNELYFRLLSKQYTNIDLNFLIENIGNIIGGYSFNSEGGYDGTIIDFIYDEDDHEFSCLVYGYNTGWYALSSNYQFTVERYEIVK